MQPFGEVAQAAEPAVSQVANQRKPKWLRGVDRERNARVRRLRVAPTGSPRNRRQGCLRYTGHFAAGFVERDAALAIGVGVCASFRGGFIPNQAGFIPLDAGFISTQQRNPRVPLRCPQPK